MIAVDLDSGRRPKCWRAARRRAIDARLVSVARPFEYATTGGKTAHALFYAPHNPDYTAPGGERPPLLVRVHGGPTAHVTLAPGPRDPVLHQSRGFAVVDVNYGGSTGYGREYRERLHGQWGIVDVDDAVNAALALADAGEVDRARLAITGGAAGGWTVLCAAAFHPDVFAAGADYFGVSDLDGLRRRHAQVRVALQRLAGRPVARGGGAVARALAGELRRPHPRADHHPPGPRGRDRAAVAVRGRRRGAAREPRAVRLPDVRGRAARLPQGRDRSSARSRRSCRSTRRCSASSPPATSNPCRSRGQTHHGAGGSP